MTGYVIGVRSPLYAAGVELLPFGLRGVGRARGDPLAAARRAAFRSARQTLYQGLLADPARSPRAGTLTPGSWVIVDEIQRLPGLLNESPLHRGAPAALRAARLSARKLRAPASTCSRTRTVAGDFPLTPEELGGQLDLERTSRSARCRWCSLPEPQETLRTYVQLYLREESRRGARANLPGLPASCRRRLCHAQSINISGLARDAGVARTPSRVNPDLEDTLLARACRVHRPARRERKHPKLYW